MLVTQPRKAAVARRLPILDGALLIEHSEHSVGNRCTMKQAKKTQNPHSVMNTHKSKHMVFMATTVLPHTTNTNFTYTHSLCSPGWACWRDEAAEPSWPSSREPCCHHTHTHTHTHTLPAPTHTHCVPLVEHAGEMRLQSLHGPAPESHAVTSADTVQEGVPLLVHAVHACPLPHQELRRLPLAHPARQVQGGFPSVRELVHAALWGSVAVEGLEGQQGLDGLAVVATGSSVDGSKPSLHGAIKEKNHSECGCKWDKKSVHKNPSITGLYCLRHPEAPLDFQCLLY